MRIVGLKIQYVIFYVNKRARGAPALFPRRRQKYFRTFVSVHNLILLAVRHLVFFIVSTDNSMRNSKSEGAKKYMESSAALEHTTDSREVRASKNWLTATSEGHH